MYGFGSPDFVRFGTLPSPTELPRYPLDLRPTLQTASTTIRRRTTLRKVGPVPEMADEGFEY